MIKVFERKLKFDTTLYLFKKGPHPLKPPNSNSGLSGHCLLPLQPSLLRLQSPREALPFNLIVHLKKISLPPISRDDG
jgi:hypothetical protein